VEETIRPETAMLAFLSLYKLVFNKTLESFNVITATEIAAIAVTVSYATTITMMIIIIFSRLLLFVLLLLLC
jgi:hypothetical protein